MKTFEGSVPDFQENKFFCKTLRISLGKLKVMESQWVSGPAEKCKMKHFLRIGNVCFCIFHSTRDHENARTYIIASKKCIILHFSIDPDTNCITITLSFP